MTDEALPVRRALARETLSRVGNRLGLPITDATVESYAPERRATVRYQADDGSAHYGKLLTRGRHITALATASRLRHAGLADIVAEPLGLFEDLGMVLFRGVDGERLSSRFLSGSYAAAARHAGAALRRLHDAALTEPLIDPSPASLATELQAARAHMDRAALLDAAAIETLEPLRRRIQVLVASTEPLTFQVAHRDFHDRQILVTHAGAVILDMDRLGSGEPAVDVGNFLAHVDFRIAFHESREDPARYVRAFLDGYGPRPEAMFESTTSLGRALSLIRNCCLYVLIPRRFESLRISCARVLDDLHSGR